MDFVIRKTTELTEEEIFSFCQLFEEVFVGHVKSVEYFKREFLNTSLGYSYHALMFDGNKMVGANSLIPCDYVYKGEHVLMAFSVDTMIKKGYRDFFNLKDLIDLIEDEARKTGIFFVFGFPNDNAYPILKKGIKYKDIGKMYTYVLPYRIGGIKPCFFFLNPLSKLFCKCLIKWSLFVANHKSYFAMIDRERETFNTYRYKWFEQDYCKVNLDNFSFIYRIKKHEGVRTAFLLDINCISARNIAMAVDYICENDGALFDLLMYVGVLPCSNFPFVRIPRKYEPKNFNFVGKFLDKKMMNKDFFDILNWNVNLSCYDLV